MNKNTTKKPLASYSIWYRICLVLIGLIALINAIALVGWITGDTLSIFYGIDGLLLDTAMENNYLILYMNTFGIIACAVMILYGAYTIYECVIDKEISFDKFRTYIIFTALSIWSIPLYHALADLALTHGRRHRSLHRAAGREHHLRRSSCQRRDRVILTHYILL